MNEEYEILEKTDSLTLINYIKCSIDIYVQILVDQKVLEYKESKKNSQEEYESMLIKLENDIRGHISTEHFFKIDAENMQFEIEELERENEKLTELLKEHDEENIVAKENEIQTLKTEIERIKQILVSYEEQNLKLANNEKKLKSQIIKKEQELANIEEKYKDQINKLTSKYLVLEEKLKSYSPTPNSSNNKTSNYSSGLNSQEDPLSKSQLPLRKKTSQGSKSSSSLNNIEKYLQQKIHSKNLINNNTNYGSTSNNNNNKINLSREKSFNNKPNESNSYIAHNDSMIVSKKHDDFLSKQDFVTKKILKDSINKKQDIRNKKKGHNRQRSLEEVARFLRNKNSSLIKEMLFNSNNNNNTHNSISKQRSNKKVNDGSNKKAHFELVNNINIYTNTLKQDNHNVYVKANMASSNSNNSNKNTNDKSAGLSNIYGTNHFHFVKVTKNKNRSVSSKK